MVLQQIVRIIEVLPLNGGNPGLMIQDVHSFQGRSFSGAELKYIPATFRAAYEKSICDNGSLPFLLFIGKKQEKIQKTFLEFDTDVKKVLQFFLQGCADIDVIVTLGNNDYGHLVYMTAALLGGYILAPMNPNETAERSKKKIEQLGERSKVFASFEIPSGAVPASLPSPRHTRSLMDPFVRIFTSGTTGYSKVVQQTEQGLLSNVDALIEHHHLQGQHKTIATALPIFHVNALEFSFMVSLLSGQRLILFESFQALQTLSIFVTEKISIYSGIPSIFKAFYDLRSKISLSGFGTLEYFVSAASALSPELIKLWNKTFSVPLLQGYGLSEAINFSLKTPVSLSREELLHWQEDFERPTVGVPLRGNEIQVLDLNGRECHEGEVGEICLRGFNVMAGYKDQEVVSLFQDGYFHTGDLGFFKNSPSNGQRFFFISGRIKDVIKRHGFSVALQEIDDFLAMLDLGEHSAVAVAFENEAAGEEVGVATSQGMPHEIIAKMKEIFENEWPAYLRPRVILKTDLPLRTESGKPRRWPLRPLFEKYKKHSFGEKILVDFGELPKS